MNYGISILGRYELKWNFLKFRIKRYFEKQVRINIDKYVMNPANERGILT